VYLVLVLLVLLVIVIPVVAVIWVAVGRRAKSRNDRAAGPSPH
jgi:cbb3-type cytochrome oxidase subunit 3